MCSNIRTFVLALGFLAGSVSSFAQDEAPKAPKLEVENVVQDFGQVKPKEVFDFTYKFANSGNDKLVISRVQSTCGCTVPELAKTEYQPGEKGEVKVRYTASQREGALTKHLYLHSNDPTNPRFELLIKSETVLKVEVEPKQIELSLVKDNAGFKDLTVRSKDGQDFSITDVMMRGNAFKFVYDSKIKAVEHKIKVITDKEVLEKNLAGVITIETDHPDCEVVSATYNTMPLFSASPSRIIMQDAKPGETISREIWVKSNYQEDVTIDKAVSSKGYMKWEVLDIKGSLAKVKVDITAPPQDKSRYFSDELMMTINEDNPIVIKCSGWYKK